MRAARIDVWREVLFLTQALYRELERRMELKKGQGPYLTYDEVVNFFKKGLLPDKKAVGPGELIYLRHGRLRIVRDQSEIKIIIKRELKKESYLALKRFKGAVACPGLVRGRVRIVMVPKDCWQMKPGEILVSNMTHPDYIIGIHKARAIVTDEGGISSHAAIVSRELNIPCVIGTKIATKVLKDGDRVEVDANKGIVRKL